MRSGLLIIGIFLGLLTNAQNQVSKSLATNRLISSSFEGQIKLDSAYSSVGISCASPWKDKEIALIVGGDVYFPIPHENEAEGYVYSNLIIPQENFSQLKIQKNQSGRSFRLHLIATPEIEAGLNLQIGPDPCAPPQTIPQSIWRAGLPSPPQSAIPTIVKHLVVHHSAGSNTDTDFTRTVRNIYTYHTQSRGWNDIGYNYLIARDGSIFAGRDPQNQADQDNIKGAHFCGKNSATMGVCLLGDFTDTLPSPAAILALEKLCSWKLYKEQLLPAASFPHPTTNDPLLLSFIGHRDGCATQCPGNSFYPLLGAVSARITQTLLSCKKNLSKKSSRTEEEPALLYISPSQIEIINLSTEIKLADLNMMDMLGRKVSMQGGLIDNTISLNRLPMGIYFLSLNYNGNTYQWKIRNQSSSQ